MPSRHSIAPAYPQHFLRPIIEPSPAQGSDPFGRPISAQSGAVQRFLGGCFFFPKTSSVFHKPRFISSSLAARSHITTPIMTTAKLAPEYIANGAVIKIHPAGGSG